MRQERLEVEFEKFSVDIFEFSWLIVLLLAKIIIRSGRGSGSGRTRARSSSNKHWYKLLRLQENKGQLLGVEHILLIISQANT